jgi:predicted O-linked N-acetylglucosamine transferase (SPINDLY family)
MPMNPALRLLLEAQRLLNAGELGRAAVILDSLVRVMPDAPDVHHLRAVAALRQGRFTAAAGAAEAAIARSAATASYHNTLGEALRGQGNYAPAQAAYERALALDARYVPALINLGNVHVAQDRLDDAERCWRHALEIVPDNPDVLNNLGVLEHRRGAHDAALAIYRSAVTLAPNDPELRTNIANLLRDMGQRDAARASYSAALAIDPRFFKARRAFGLMLLADGKAEDALVQLEEAAAIDPRSYGVWVDVASAQLKLQRLDAAQAALERAVACDARGLDAHVALAAVLRTKGRNEEAAARYRLAIAARPEDAGPVEAMLAMMVPSIPADVATIQAARAHFKSSIENLIRRRLRLSSIVREIGLTNFDLAYHGEDDRPLQQLFAEFCLSAQPDLAFVAPHCRRGAVPGARIRVGFYARQLAYGHSVWQTAIGFIEGLDPARFAVSVIMPANTAPFAPSRPERAVPVVTVPEDLDGARAAIAALELDVLVHGEIGMDMLGYALAFSRLAPVQCALMGHPATSGIPTIDAFVSGAPFEPADGATHYSERLLQLSTNFARFAPPQKAVGGLTRADFGLPTDRAAYLCPQTLFKFHPDFDRILAGILAEDRRGVLVLMHDNRSPEIAQALSRRLAGAGVPLGRVIWLDRQHQNRFFALIELCDAVLDTLHFNGGTTSLQAFALGAPVVTMPGRFMRGRFTAGLYRRMGMADLVAHDAADYARITARLGNDPVWRRTIVEQLREFSPVLFDDEQPVRDFAAALEAALVAPRRVA